ncbi:MAG: hypothetical protein AAB393_11825 [Bacteroidota bacterium]
MKNLLRENAARVAQKLLEELETVLPVVESVIEQTRRPVVHGQRVPAQEKLVSIFEPTTS